MSRGTALITGPTAGIGRAFERATAGGRRDRTHTSARVTARARNARMSARTAASDRSKDARYWT
jgi:NAD(P)-dependent dehydrogenase (short-subunit alcohol dehydrogenase family)